MCVAITHRNAMLLTSAGKHAGGVQAFCLYCEVDNTGDGRLSTPILLPRYRFLPARCLLSRVLAVVVCVCVSVCLSHTGQGEAT